MRTKTLLLTAALSVAGAASMMAQVYSVNAVGYINLTLNAGFNLVGNQLDNTKGNKVSDVLTGIPDGTIVYKYVGGATGFSVNGFDSSLGGWDNPNDTLAPGEGAFVRVPGTAAVTVTLVGEVPQGNLTTALPAGFTIVASKVPQAGALQGLLGYPVADGDVIYRYVGGATGYSIYSFDSSLGGWDPSDPPIAVGEAFWSRKVAAASWARTFSVNTP